LEEAKLINQCRRGDKKAQNELYYTFADRLFRVAIRYVKEEAEAEDIVIVAFTKIFRNIGDFEYRNEGSLLAWMRKIIVNESLMTLRKQHNFNLTETLDEEMPTPDLSSFQELEAGYIYQLIVDLPSGYRTVFNLYVVEGYDHREIGQLLGISENTSRSQLLKAKSLLKKKIEKGGYRYGT
jgi:RNA polymerase sigma factor (sigma-70 family)